jgi:AcrR family transcriptional regulator
MERRAEQVNQTRQRIVEAAARLHGTVGPAATTIVAIAELAQVTRLTVYRHFPDEAALFAACSAHWAAGQQFPDPAAWARSSDPAERLRAGLADLYRFYRAGSGMLANIYRDVAVLPEGQQRMLREQGEAACRVLAGPFGGSGRQRGRVRAAVAHAAAFWTWYSLCAEQGLSDDEAVQLMIAMVLAAAGSRRPAQAAARSRPASRGT